MIHATRCHQVLLTSFLLAVGTCGTGCPQPAGHQQLPPDPDPPTTAAQPTLPRCTIVLSDVTAQTGVTFVHFDGSAGNRYIMETMSAGLALLDFDGDGLIDIYLLNGAPLRGTHYDHPPRNALYRNNGDWTFTDVTDQAGVGDTSFSLGVTVGDYNNSGFPDLFVNNFGPNVLYRNNGDGTFTNVTDEAGVAGGDRVAAGASMLDINHDGNLDLYVANYVQFSYDTHQMLYRGGVPMYPGPLDHPPATDQLFRNNGDGTFADISQQSGIASRAGTSMGMIALDANGNGFTDVLVVNDVMANFLFENDGQGNFREVGVASGLAFDANGLPQSSMGVDGGDYDNDGRLDLYVTSYRDELTALYRNMGDGFFLDLTRTTRAGHGSLPYVTWGTGFVDFDNDGDRDLFVACGHTEDNIELHDPSASYRAPNLLLQNQLIETGEPQFVNVSEQSGDGLRPVHASRGAGFDDLDNDGRVDVVVLNIRQQPTILRNESPGNHRWLQIQLRGVRSNRDGVGARVQVAAGDLVQTAQVHSGRGYQSHWGTRLHFGLGNRSGADRVEVHWPGGGTDVLEHVSANQRLTIIEGTTPPVHSSSKSITFGPSSVTTAVRSEVFGSPYFAGIPPRIPVLDGPPLAPAAMAAP